MIIPFMLLNVFTSGENSTLMYILSYFPLSAPLSLMLRAIFNNLPTWELIAGVVDLTICSLVIIRIATHVFCHNAVDFSIKDKFKNFGKTRKNWR
jgi:ABC-2 type transport system permease protein